MTSTNLQLDVLAFIIDFQRDEFWPPTAAEIAEHFGWASPNSATGHLAALKRQGLLEVYPRARSIRPTEKGWRLYSEEKVLPALSRNRKHT